MGGLAPYSSDDLRKASNSYHQTPYVCVIKGGVDFGPVQILFYPFHNYVWLAIIIFHLIAIIIINQLSIIDKSITKLCALSLGYPIIIKDAKVKKLIILSFWLLFSLLLRTVYQGVLFDYVRMNRILKLPDTFNELAVKKYKIWLFYDEYLGDHPFLTAPKIVDNYNLSDRLTILGNSSFNYATVTAMDRMLYYQSLGQFHIVKEVVYQKQISFYLTPKSWIRKAINDELMYMAACGINDFLMKKYLYRKKGDLPKSAPVITFERLVGIFQIWALLLMFSILIFGLEFVFKKKCK